MINSTAQQSAMADMLSSYALAVLHDNARRELGEKAEHDA